MSLIAHTKLPTKIFVGCGQVRHARHAPKRNRFSYKSFFLLIPMRAWDAGMVGSAPARNRSNSLSFWDADHGEGARESATSALNWLDAYLQAQGIVDADGQVWLQTYPRVWGFVFKPVSFWYCYGSDGRLRAVVAEVNNTFGNRHCYLLPMQDLAQGFRCEKAFHVSPFFAVEGEYRFRFALSEERQALACIDYYLSREDGTSELALSTSISGALEPWSASMSWRLHLRYPLHSFGVVIRIHWQALRLYLKGVHFFGAQPSGSGK